jgi:hypothetical protein
MSEIRAQIAYHFKIDPAKLVTGLVRIPEQITRTVSVGAELVTEKVSPDCLLPADRAAIISEIEKQVVEATRTAKPIGAAAATNQPEPGPAATEESAF